MHYFDRLKINKLLGMETKEMPKDDVVILGWVRTKRDMKDFSFVEVNDGSCVQNLQVIVDHDKGFDIEKIKTGASIKLIGKLNPLEGRKQKVEMLPNELVIVGECPDDFPMQKKRHSFEYLREVAHLRPRTNAFGVMNRFRSKIAYACHKFFQEKGFYYITTPVITTNDCEGAGEVFKVTTMDLENIPKTENGKVDYAQDFFTEETGLTVSGQLEGEIMACSLGDIYTFCPAFRAEKSNTTRHLSELWMIEPEMAFCDLSEDVQVAVEFLKYLFNYALNECAEDMDFFNRFVEKGIIQNLEQIVSSDFEIVEYTKAVEIIQKAQKKQKFEYELTWGKELQTEHERYLSEKYFKKPVVVINYPRESKAFYMKVNDDEKTVAAMDILVPKVGEIIGGSQREDRLDYLETLIKEKNIHDEKLWWYYELRKYGSVPHSGFGLGFERALMYMSGMTNIRDVIPFPRTPRNCRF